MDQTLDTNGAGLYRIASLYGAPEFVKRAAASDLSPSARMEPACYGDPRSRHYPLHTKSATWASYAFFLDNVRDGRHRPVDAGVIEERILRAGQSYGIPNDLARLKEAFASDRAATEADLPDESYAIVWQNGDGSKERHLPVRNSLEVVKAAEYLAEHRDRFEFEARRRLAEVVLEKVAELGVRLVPPLAELVEKQAGLGACSAADAAGLVCGRVAASRRGGGVLSAEQEGLLKLADTLRAQPTAAHDPDLRVKLAAVLDRFDRERGLLSEVRAGTLPRLEDVLFGLTREKMAACQAEHTQTVTGNIYKLADVERLRLGDVEATLGEELAAALTSDGLHVDGEKCGAVLPTLVRPDAVLFDRLMAAAGLGAVAKQASAESIGFEHSYLQLLAGQKAG